MRLEVRLMLQREGGGESGNRQSRESEQAADPVRFSLGAPGPRGCGVTGLGVESTMNQE